MSNLCKICKISLDSKRSKICKSKICRSKWKMERNKNLTPVVKNCKQCGIEFETIDRRNNFCSNECRVSHRHKTMEIKYGQKSITSKTPESIEKTKRTIEERYNGSVKRQRWLKDRGYEDIESFLEAVKDFCQTYNIAPSSKFCLDHFNMSSAVISNLHRFGYSELINLHSTQSSYELELFDFIKSLDIKSLPNDRQVLYGKELDLYMPEYNFAIEFHGLVHHSERPVFYEKDLSKIKKQHEFKYLKCKEQNIKLMQIFEDEWINKRPIIESMISSRLGLSKRTIFARNTEVKEIPKKELIKFFNAHHIAGYTNSMVGFGLYYKGELVSALSLRSTWTRKYGSNVLEIARFASALNTQVVGGFSKIIKRAKIWANNRNYKKILTYADCRFGSGNVYLKYGFNYRGKTAPNYFYEKNGIREDRFSHKKNNDADFIAEFGNTEREQNNNRGWYAIYDAGSEIYLLDL